MTTQTINISAGDETPEVVNLAGIPLDIWERFKANAERQFPKDGDLAWAAYLSEVIVAAGGGDGETVSYFMTKVPTAYALEIQNQLSQVGMTWTQFHAYLLRAASFAPNNLRLANFSQSGHTGVFIALGVDPQTFLNVEEQTGTGFERVMATVLATAQAGLLQFPADMKFIETIKPANE